MCTASIIPFRTRRDVAEGQVASVRLRLITNRDEQRHRPAATPPKWRRDRATGVRAIYPIDPLGGGTWVAASERGLVMCLLNANPTPYPVLPESHRLVSRGRIIPSVLGCASAAEAAEEFRGMRVERYAPFSLLAADVCGGDGKAGGGGAASIWRVDWDRTRLEVREVSGAGGPVCAVSSGLGDSLVQARMPLFAGSVGLAWEVWRAHGGDVETVLTAQERFHRHAWDDRPEISVMMSRQDARTVSVTVVDIERVGNELPVVRMDYRAVRDAKASCAVAVGGAVGSARPATVG